MPRKWIRGALVGGVAFLLANVVSNLLFFQLGSPLLFDNPAQSEKVLAVLFEMEPRPLMFTNGMLYMAIVVVIGFIHGVVFALVEPSLPRGRTQKGLAFAGILWALMALYFEFHAPFNMFGEPLPLVALELLFWIAVVGVEGLILAWGYGTPQGRIDGRSARPRDSSR